MESISFSFLNSIKIEFFNLKEKFHHTVTENEIELIKKTTLFNNLDKDSFDELLQSISLIKYPSGKLIIREGDRGDDLFIILEGTVRVFTYDLNGQKIQLKELSKGDYFGEQAPLGKVVKMRNANIEAITDTIVIRVNGKYISDLIQIDALLKARLEEMRYNQAIKIVTSSTGLNDGIEFIFHQIEKPNIIEFRNNQYIFKAGDKADRAYIILQGKVKLLIPDKTTGTFSKVMLNRGHLFGELGVIRNAPRAATAIAHSGLRLLAIEADYFKKQVSENPQLQQILSALQEIYKIPMKDTVEQYLGNSQGEGSAITNIYKLDDGRFIISSKTLKDNLFTMATMNLPGNEHYQYKNGESSIELEVTDHHIVGIKACGIWEILPDLCRLLLNQEVIQKSVLENFELTGNIRQ